MASANCPDCLLRIAASLAHPVWHQIMFLLVQAVGAAASLAKTQNGKVTVLLVDVQEPGLEEATTRSEALAWQFREAGFEHFEILSKVGEGLHSLCCCQVCLHAQAADQQGIRASGAAACRSSWRLSGHRRTSHCRCNL